MIGSARLTLRPIRLGFLVNPKDAIAVRRAIQITSSLWGGAQNPLVPVFKRNKSAIWKHSVSTKWSAERITIGYLDAFDPDVLVQCCHHIPQYITELGLEIIKPEEIWNSFIESNGRDGPSYGVGIFEILTQIYEKHFRYPDKHKPRIVFPKIPRKNALFWSAFLGELPEFAVRFIQEFFKEELEIDDSPFRIAELRSLFTPSTIFTKRLTQYELDSRKQGSRLMKDHAVFFLDARKSEDIIDYWNLRATGRAILPVPKQLQDVPEIRNQVGDFIKSAVRLINPEQNIYSHASFINGRHIRPEEMETFARNLDISGLSEGKKTEMPFSFQNWYPRIWDEWARSNDGVEVDDLYSAHKSITLSGAQDSIRAEPISPEFMDERVFTGKPRYANDVEFSIYSFGEAVMPAEAFPRTNGPTVKKALVGPFSDESCRVGRNGFVLLEKWEAERSWKIFSAQDIFFAWLGDHGLEAQLSQSGIFAREIRAQLAGNVRLLANEGLLKLLERMNSGPDGERALPVAEVKNRLGRLSNALVSANVFRIGPRVQCPYCNRRTWFNLDDVKEQMTCPRCLRIYPAVERLHKSTWCYKTAGPFSIHDHAGGAYAVLLSIEFFSNYRMSLDFKTTAAFSFEAKSHDGELFEADFGLLWKERNAKGVMDGLVFGECKTFNRFESRDFSRMRKLGIEFPGAILAFCTLRKSLTKFELREIKRIAKAGRKYWKNDRPRNPVLILTGNELLENYYGTPPSWEGMGCVAKNDRYEGLLRTCEITQQIYLDLPPWQQEWLENIDKKRRRFQARATRAKKIT